MCTRRFYSRFTHVVRNVLFLVYYSGMSFFFGIDGRCSNKDQRPYDRRPLSRKEHDLFERSSKMATEADATMDIS